MAIDYPLIGQRIAACRREKHITQEQLAEHLDVSTAFISKIERGRTQISLERLVQICHYLDTTPARILEGTDRASSLYLLPEMSRLLEQCPKESLPLIKSMIEDVIRLYPKAP